MIRVRQVEVDVYKSNEKILKESIAKKLKININDIKSIKINKESIDARHKPYINYIYEVDIDVLNEDKILKYNKSIDVLKTPNEAYKCEITGNIKLNNRIVIVGTGPAGLFTAYNLARYGYKPLIIERGEKVEDRVKTVEEFWNTGKLNINSNVQFGEGGAGTFSDGKLNTLVKDPEHRGKEVFKIFVENGANPNILYVNKPHIGTDILRNVVKNMRNEIISMGGEFRYNTCLTNIIYNNERIVKIEVNNNEFIDTDVLVLAIGHSARDTFKMLYDNKINMESKPFAIGLRIEHPQKLINKSQYGVEFHEILENASYKLTHHSSSDRGVYTFCMCPGGYVVNSSSEEGMLAINGMSYSNRDSLNANSAILVTITPDDFGNHPLDGLEFQRKLEKKAFEIGKGKIPIQLFKDYKENKISNAFGSINPLFKGNYNFSNLNELFPDYINESIKEGIISWDRKIKGFASNDAILAGCESRSSSPIRINRNELGECNIKGIYPIGEGAGYAGGITSSAIDGLKISEYIMQKYIP